MIIAVPKEVHSHEKRVATTPEVVPQLIKLGYQVQVETGAGEAARFSDDDYRQAGAEIISDTRQLWQRADIVLKVRPPEGHPILDVHEADLLADGKTLISFIWPGQNQPLLEKFSAQNQTVIAMDSVPRISRAQKLDALSSMANIAGYRAVIEAANHFGRFFTGQITAAGKVPPAKVLVIGAGVAGLAAIGAASGMGAIVRAFDTRPEVKEQVESVGAEFLELEFEEDSSGEGGYAKTMSKEFIEAEMALFAEQAAEVDIIITTALIPGRPAPKLITAEMVKSMKQGSVIVDLAAEQGGNCELTQPGKVASEHGVTLIGYEDLPSRLSTQSSQLYATNLRHMITDLTPEKDGVLTIDLDDEVVRGATVSHQGEILYPPPPPRLSAQPAKATTVEVEPKPETAAKSRSWITIAAIALGGLGVLGLGQIAPPSFMSHFTVFVLACFIGWQVIWNVTPALHTPLMSVTNAISSIIIIGALIQISASHNLVIVLSAIAILIASINIAGGFFVSQRMLSMFRK